MSGAAESIVPEAIRERFPYRMKDLCDLTGLPRQAIHFYIQSGLLPPGQKTGRNMAFYGEEHVARLKLVKRLQHERFLPLRAIKAMLDGGAGHYSEEQQRFLEALRGELGSTLAHGTDRALERIDATKLLEDNHVTREELARMVEIGLVGALDSEDGRPLVAVEDTWVIENLGRMRAAGFTPELGFGVDDMVPYVDAVDGMLERDVALLSDRLSHLPPAVVARMLERSVPLLHEFLVRYHARRVRDFLSSI